MLQAIILSLVLINGLGLRATDQLVFYLGNMFIAVVFFSIMYGVAYAVGLVGTPIIFILFILQLASFSGAEIKNKRFLFCHELFEMFI